MCALSAATFFKGCKSLNLFSAIRPDSHR
jgi:hypothetical protein